MSPPPRVDAVLYPDTPTAEIAVDQSTLTTFLNQDILIQGVVTYPLTPAHIPTIQLRHQNSMIDFMLVDVNQADIASDGIKVTASGKTYTPYKVGTSNEYLLILPVGTAYPRVEITTVQGARYATTVNIASTVINNCYCIKLIGVELSLSSVNVIDWTYGNALAGQYTTPASYPTFRGPANTSATLYFNNGLSETITFSDRGETTVKPAGRIIIQINDLTLPTPLILDEMYVDLNPYLDT